MSETIYRFVILKVLIKTFVLILDMNIVGGA